MPRNENEPAAILATWTTLEVLSPQTYRQPEDLAAGDRRTVANLSEKGLPWYNGERSRPNYQLYYQVILGSIRMDRATDELVKAFGEDEERIRPEREKAAIAAVLVDRQGIVLEENSIAVSSFAWALPLALKLQLGHLGAWAAIEPKIVGALGSIVRRFDSDGRPVRLDLPTIQVAYGWLLSQFGLAPHLVEPPTFALRVYHYFKAKSPPEASLLNSFFLADLGRAASLVTRNTAGAGLRRYLGIYPQKDTFDLLRDRTSLERAVAPTRIPASRWPPPGGHPLVILQQAAVNLARSELSDAEGILAVNGPPGTGKTTLLRDVVAACVVDRAFAMVTFETPEKAFTASGQKMAAGQTAFFHLYRLDERLKGHEVLVTSSNNRAVENVSKELPSAKAIGRPTTELTYFKSISDVVLNSRTPSAEEGTDLDLTESWGLIAAILGNSKNRNAFQKAFWWDDDRSFRVYLKAAKGDSVVRETRDLNTGLLERNTPFVVVAENPSSGQAASANWRKARARFLEVKGDIDSELKTLEAVRQMCLRLAEEQRPLREIEAHYHGLEVQLTTRQAAIPPLQVAVEVATTEHQVRETALGRHRTGRPGLVARMLHTSRWTTWSSQNLGLVTAVRASAGRQAESVKALSEAMSELEAVSTRIRAAGTELSGRRQTVAMLEQSIENRRHLGNTLVDDRVFEGGHENWNRLSPWVSSRLNRKREDLFIAALGVHKAFIDASAQKLLHNLNVLMNAFTAGALQDQAKRELLGDLWSTLFLVIPVISTTFASVDRMLGDLPAGSIGWLLIDEAGQALPQAAVGAIMRAKRSIVVGDPLQIAPVVTIPERLTSRICSFFKVDKATWSAPEASAQTLADRASRFQTSFGSDPGHRLVGVPLLVHRRCQEPMFGVSNRVAYNGQMVHAVGPRDAGAIGHVLGPSKWFDVDGDADSKWCQTEGEVVVDMLRRIAIAGVVDPDIFVITPFRIVAQEMRRRLEHEPSIFSAFQADPLKWTDHRVGTIHTFQGREADTVILLLGAPKASQNGARNWAGGSPNIVNVAVSRAKQNLYVVGSHGAWSGAGHFLELARSLPTMRV